MTDTLPCARHGEFIGRCPMCHHYVVGELAWGDLMEFEIVPVVQSKDTRQVVDALLDVE